jgi:GTP pyrophosphokinase
VIGPDVRPMDVMIRTEGMHRVAEYGIAALRRYSHGVEHDDKYEFDWLQRVLDWQAEAPDSGEFMASLRYDLSDHEVLVFTAKGEPVSLPAGATPVDFAYAQSTWLGDRCFGTRVNGQLVPLSSTLADGDVVEVLTALSGYTGPSEEWLEFAKSPQAQIQIRRWFADQLADGAVAAGRDAISAALADEGRVLAHDLPLLVLARSLDYPDVDALCAAVAAEQLAAASVARKLIVIVDGPEQA